MWVWARRGRHGCLVVSVDDQSAPNLAQLYFRIESYNTIGLQPTYDDISVSA